MNKRLTELTEAFTEDGIKKLKVSQTLTFDFEGNRTTYKIMKIKDGRIWAKKISLYKVDDIVFGDKDIKKIGETLNG